MRTLTPEHKEKLRIAKRNYYGSLTGKRPYNRNIDKSCKSIEQIRSEALDIIEKFNDINRSEGEITPEIINKYFNKEDKKYAYEHSFF